MKTASINELKKELLTLPPKTVLELCLRLAKLKKENKELLTYLLFEAHDKATYIESVKKEINDDFWCLPRSNMYIIKKGLRRILKSISKHSKYVGRKEAEAELLIHFCNNFCNSNIRWKTNKGLSNLYASQIKKLNTIVEQLHEDLRFDYKKQLDQLCF